MHTNFHTVEHTRTPRAQQLSRDLRTLYPELAAHNERVDTFSMVRMMNDMALQEFHEGKSHEANLCSAAARAQGGQHDPQRVVVPWSVFQQRDMNTASAQSGGNLIGHNSVGPLDVLRPFSVVARMGVNALENNIQNLSLPNLTGAVTGQWLATDNTNITSSDPTVGVVSSRPKTAGALMRASRQFLLQAANAERVIRQQLLAAMGACLDQAVLSGSGASGQPTGIVNTAGIGATSGAVSWATALDALQTLGEAGANDDNIKFVSTPAVRRLLQAREVVSTSGRMIWDNNQIAGKSAAVTSDCPAATIIAGDWSQCLLVFWGGGIEIQVDPYTSFQTGAVQVRALMFADVNVPKPGAFVKHTAVS